jgi:hypothetical protein
LHPTAEQGSLCFRCGGTRRPEGLLAPTHASATARSHPSKLSPRWQPCRLTTTVASSAFAETLRAEPASRPTHACSAPTRTTRHAYASNPPDAGFSPLRRAKRPDMDRRPTGPGHRSDRRFLDRTALRPAATHAAFAAMARRPLLCRRFRRRLLRAFTVSRTWAVRDADPHTGQGRRRRGLTTTPRVSPLRVGKDHTARRGHRCASASLKASRRTSTTLGSQLLGYWKVASHPCKRRGATVVFPSSPDPDRRHLAFDHRTDRGRCTAPKCGVPRPTPRSE